MDIYSATALKNSQGPVVRTMVGLAATTDGSAWPLLLVVLAAAAATTITAAIIMVVRRKIQRRRREDAKINAKAVDVLPGMFSARSHKGDDDHSSKDGTEQTDASFMSESSFQIQRITI